ncbi:MAG: hypothetical protein VB140_08655 [Burkholderia sp.]
MRVNVNGSRSIYATTPNNSTISGYSLSRCIARSKNVLTMIACLSNLSNLAVPTIQL